MMYRLCAFLSLVFLTGCSATLATGGNSATAQLGTMSIGDKLGGAVHHVVQFTAADFRHAASLGLAARTAGKLPDGDRWPECFADLADRIDAGQIVSTAADPSGLATLAMKFHISKYKLDEPINAACAQVVLALEKDGVRIATAAGLSIVPGGAAAAQGLGALGQIRGLIGR